MSNEELAVRIQAGEATVYSVLWEQVKGFVCNAAYRFYNHYTERCNAHGVDSSDLVQAGYFALVDCVNAYDPQTGYKLLSFIKYPLMNRFQETLGIRTTKGKAEPLNKCISLDMETTEDGNTLVEIIPDQHAGEMFEESEHALYTEQLHRKLEEVMSRALTPEQKQVINWRYYGGLSLDRAGERAGKSRERIRQIERASLRVLRKPQHARELKPFELWNHSYYAGNVSSFKTTQVSNVEMIVERIDQWEREHRKKASYGVRIGIIHEINSTHAVEVNRTEESFEECMKRIKGQAKAKQLVWG